MKTARCPSIHAMTASAGSLPPPKKTPTNLNRFLLVAVFKILDFKNILCVQ
ncbi:hypothetical protein BVRB_3g056430 [Beta vulgaris subsp. vulgaris]|nr:hypothetical protein BVRB_3g056430 [Beta vulgaris subsp. vulgaris]